MTLVLTDKNFKAEVTDSKGTVLVDFWAPWCGPCKIQGPIVEQLAHEFSGKQNVKIAKINVDENPETAQAHQIFSIPTIVFFKDGKPVDQLIGLQTKTSLAAKLQEHAA